MGQEEIDAVSRVLKSGWIGLGPETALFEKNLERFLGKKHVVTTNSATSALHLALIISGVTEGDEVIAPALTFVSTNHVILYQKATPVFCDVDPVTLCANPLDIISKITPKTKAIIVVHYAGHPVDMDPLVKIAREKNITLIEDNAHGLGGEYKGKKLGTIGDIGCFSFHAVKGVAMGDGGALWVGSKKTADTLKELRWMGISKDTWKRSDEKSYSWEYKVPLLGYKYHTNDILAAIGNVQLKNYPKALKRKTQIRKMYTEGLNNLTWLTLPRTQSYAKHGEHTYFVQLDNRDALIDYLAERDIATGVHYEPNNHYPMYKDFSADIPVTEAVWKKTLLLPFYTELTDKEVKTIISAIQSFTS